MKYLKSTIILLIQLVLGWFVSAKYLEPVILKVFDLDTHEKYLDIWFVIFATIELIAIFVYVFYIHKVYKTNKHLIKSPSGHS